MLYKFKDEDILHSRIKTHPKSSFTIYDRKTYYNSKFNENGLNSSPILAEQGTISLYELNVDRVAGQKIYPFIVKDGSLDAFKTTTTGQFNSQIQYGDVMTGSSYPLTASLSKDYFAANSSRKELTSLRNTLEFYRKHSEHYAYSSSHGNKASQSLGLVSVPSIFYGSQIKKGTVDLKFYVSGTLIARAQDVGRNGVLLQTEPTGSTGSGSVAGVILYREGFMVMTGAWDITDEHQEPYIPGGGNTNPQWVHFASTGSTGASENLPSSSFALSFEGTNYVNVMTMNCRAQKGELNHSNNPTFLDYNQVSTASTNAISSSKVYREYDKLTIKNIVKSPFTDHTGSFEKITYISQIAIYDESKNIIAIAKLASPTRKKEASSFTYKLKIDI